MKVYKGYFLVKKSEYNALLNRCLQLEKKVEELTAQLKINSRNSSKPPSSDGLKKKIKNNRQKSNRSAGSQFGHKGNGLSPMENVDEKIICPVKKQCECGADLSRKEIVRMEKRQVIDTPEKLIHVKEYLVEVKKCKCGKEHKGDCNYEQRVQYGNGLKSLLVYLNQYQFIPNERLQEMMKDVFGLSLSDGLIFSSATDCFDNLTNTIEMIKEGLKESPLIHNDETGMRCDGKTQYIHCASNEHLTHFAIHSKRGCEAIDEIGILPEFKGISVHDRWASYDRYNCTHALCNAHLLRDLKFVHEEMNRKWAKEVIHHLQQINQRKKEGWLTTNFTTRTENKMAEIIRRALAREPKEINLLGKRGKKPQNKSVLLLNVFRDRKKEIMLFARNKDVPFDNNLCERDLRMIKLKQKISGCFRSKFGAEIFCAIRSYISTIRKKGFLVWEAIKQALIGKSNFIYILD
jgi:transposase